MQYNITVFMRFIDSMQTINREYFLVISLN